MRQIQRSVIRGRAGCLWETDDAKSSIRDPASLGSWRRGSRMYDFRPCARFGHDGESLPLREKARALRRRRLKNLAIIVLVISVAFVAHLAEIGLWAVLLVLCGEFQELGTAYYHSAVNYTTLGYGDLQIGRAHV